MPHDNVRNDLVLAAMGRRSILEVLTKRSLTMWNLPASAETVRKWVRSAEIDSGQRLGTS